MFKACIPFVLLFITISSCTQKNNGFKKIAGYTQGTTYHMTYEAKFGDAIHQEVDSLLRVFDNSLSTYLPGSLISAFNSNLRGVVADDLLRRVVDVSADMYNKSDGFFDITVAPLVNAFGFGFGEKQEINTALIDSLKQYVGFSHIQLKGDSLIKTIPELMIDVNAIAQGFSVDYIANYFDQLGMKNYLIEIGGEVRTKGKKDNGENWKIGIDKPIDNNMVPGDKLQAVLSLSGKSLATSGNYRKFYEKDGVKYSHSFNPKTGFPVLSNLLSATVVTDECIVADAYATTFMVAGMEKAKEMLNSEKDLEAVLVYSDAEGNFKTYVTEGLKIHYKEISN